MKKGCLITVEGGEGSGKSTLIQSLMLALQNVGVRALSTREPGGTEGGEEIRKLLVHGQAHRWDAMSETLLLFAARRDLLTNVIQPALEKGNWVLCDRFVDSTVAYQGFAGGLDISFIRNLYKAISGGLTPDLTLILDIDPQIGLKRACARLAASKENEGRFESMSFEFHQKIREGFLQIARGDPDRCVMISSEESPEEVLRQATACINDRLKVGLVP